MTSRRSAYSTLALLTITYVFAYADRYLMAMLVQPIKSDLHLSDSAIGLLLVLPSPRSTRQLVFRWAVSQIASIGECS